MNHFNQRHFWVTNVLYITKGSSFIFSNDFVNRIVDFSFIVLLNVINQHSNIDITIWQVQLCSKWSKILDTCLRVLFINHLFDSKLWKKNTGWIFSVLFHALFLLALCIKRIPLFNCEVSNKYLQFIVFALISMEQFFCIWRVELFVRLVSRFMEELNFWFNWIE